MEVENPTAECSAPNPLMATGEDVTPNKDGGVLKTIKTLGDTTEEDRPMKGDTVSVHYVGTLTNGEEFDSSRSRNEKFTFKLGEGSVIKAWDMGVAAMRRGEVAILTCRPEYAYGKTGQGKIPPDATLIFEIELFDWTGEDLTDANDGGIVRRTLKPGTGSDKPVENASVNVHLIGMLGDVTFDDRDVSFSLSEGNEHNIPDGIETALMKMQGGELAEVILKPKYGFGSQGHSEFNVPPGATLKYRVQLNSFEKIKESWEMDPPERIVGAESAKTKGTQAYKAGNFNSAIKHYKKIINYLDYETTCSDEEKKSFREIMLIGHLNLAMAYIKVEDYTQAVGACQKALELDADNVKGLFRRGQARMALTDHQEAKADFARALVLDPGNKLARSQLAVCQQKLKLANQREKQIYGNMFEKFADRDRKSEEIKAANAPPVEYGGNFDKDSADPASDGTPSTNSSDPSTPSEENMEIDESRSPDITGKIQESAMDPEEPSNKGDTVTPDQPTPDQPTADQPTADQPTADQPTADQPTAT